MCISCEINNIVKQANSANNGDSGTEFGSSGDGEDGEHNGLGLVKISSIFATQGDFSSWNRII